MADPTLARAGGPVTIGLSDGRMQNRRLAKFSPQLTALAVEPISPKERIADALIPVENIAFVGFLSRPGEKVERLAGTPATMKVHVAGGKSFLVEAVDPMPDEGGFFARPTDSATPYSEIYFYYRGVNRREELQPLGAMLVA